MFILYILLIIIFIIIFISSIKNFEKFDNDDDNTILITENIYNFPIKNYISPEIIDLILGSIKKSKNIPNNLLYHTDKKYATLYIDPYVNYYLLNNITNNILYDIKGYFVYISVKKLKPYECSWDLENKIIGYTNISDYYFINAIIKGHRIDITTITLIRISPNDLINNMNVFITKKLDCLITYVIPDSKYVTILENNNLFVTGFKDMDINRVRAFYPFVNYDYIDLKTLFPKKLMALSTYTDNDDYNANKKILIPSMNYIILYNIPIVLTDGEENFKNIEHFITRVDLSKDAYDPKYFCYGNDNINNKFQCNSPYDVDNSIKKTYNFWDKICTLNEDCPFYNKITNKGGCKIIDIDKDPNITNLRGYCEFPVGIKKIGFTKYSNEGNFAPFCYGCENSEDLDCCNKQSIPDYVYPNDFEERSKNNKDTIVSKFDYII